MPFKSGKDSWEEVERHGIKGSFHSYQGLPHSANMDELKDVANWISSILSDTKL